MKRLQFTDLVMVLQDSFDEDLMDNVNTSGDGLTHYLPETNDPLAGYMMMKVFDSYEEEADNNEKINSFYSVLEDMRAKLDDMEQSLDNWEDFVGEERDEE